MDLIGDVFREHGYEGASLAHVTAATGLGRGSLYNYFPGGKEQMARDVLAAIDSWFTDIVFTPLNEHGSIDEMLTAASTYFRSGERICLPGLFAIGRERDAFTDSVHNYFAEWIKALAAALQREGRPAQEARDTATAAVAAIQGAIVIARALNDTTPFDRTIGDLRERLVTTKG